MALDTKTEAEYILAYKRAIYSGISNEIQWQMKHGIDREDARDRLRYMVDKYCEEELVGGDSLREELNRYCELAEAKYGEKRTEHSDLPKEIRRKPVARR